MGLGVYDHFRVADGCGGGGQMRTNAKMTPQQIAKAVTLWQDGDTYEDIAALMHISRHQIGDAVAQWTKDNAERTKWVLVASTWQPTRTLTKINVMGQHSSVHYGRMVWTWETRPVL